MSDLKTKRNKKNAVDFIKCVEDDVRREDARRILTIMQGITGEKPAMWGDSIVGFGSYRYRYDSGREGEWFLTGFSPRKANLVLYLMSGFSQLQHYLDHLGKHKTGKSCLYITRLENIDLDVLESMIRKSIEIVREREKAEKHS